MLRILAVMIATGVAAPDADAAIFMGDPDIGFQIDRPQQDIYDGDVYVDKLRVHSCDGSWTDYAVNRWVDPTVGPRVTVNGGDLCKVTWYWGSDIVLYGSGFTIVATPSYTHADIDPIADSAVSPWSVTKGDLPSGGGPRLTPTID